MRMKLSPLTLKMLALFLTTVLGLSAMSMPVKAMNQTNVTKIDIPDMKICYCNKYEPGRTYSPQETVCHEGLLYVQRWWTLSEPDPYNENSGWEKIGNCPCPCHESNEPEPFDPNKDYFGGELVTYNGYVYRALWWNRGTTPDNSTAWELVYYPM